MKRSAIINYWSGVMRILGKIKSTDVLNCCFACSLWDVPLEKCHITPKSKGGSNLEDNLHLLCPRCHKASEGLEDQNYWTWFCNRSLMCTLSESYISQYGFQDFTNLMTSKNESLRMLLLITSAIDEISKSSVSHRTKAALTAYKARGGKLGSHLPQCRTLTDEARQRGITNASIARSKSAHHYWTARSDLVQQIQKQRKQGMTLKHIASNLNKRGITTRRGRQWTAVQVRQLCMSDKSPLTLSPHKEFDYA